MTRKVLNTNMSFTKVLFVSIKDITNNLSYKDDPIYIPHILNFIRERVFEGYKIVLIGEFVDIDYGDIRPVDVNTFISNVLADITIMSNNNNLGYVYNIKDIYISTFIIDAENSCWALPAPTILVNLNNSYTIDGHNSIILGSSQDHIDFARNTDIKFLNVNDL